MKWLALSSDCIENVGGIVAKDFASSTHYSIELKQVKMLQSLL